MQFVDTNIFIFEDALSFATMERQKISELYGYDRDIDRIQGSEITRLEPLPFIVRNLSPYVVGEQNWICCNYRLSLK